MKMTFRWYGANSDSISLKQIKQIPGMTGLMGVLDYKAAGEVWTEEEIKAYVDEVHAAGHECEVIASVNVHEDIKIGLPSRDQLIENYKKSLEAVGKAGIHLVCYNFMPVFDWTRTDLAMPLEDGSVDVVLCTEVFEHLPEPLLALQEFSRILKKGGTLLLTAPFCSLTHMAPYYYANGFSKYWYEESLKKFGFQIDEMEQRGSFYQWLAQEIHRLPEIAQRYSHYDMSREDRETLTDSLKLLHQLDQMDAGGGSGEVLCFGYMLAAHRE